MNANGSDAGRQGAGQAHSRLGGRVRGGAQKKAWLDACYYRFKGRAFSFDLDTDVNRNSLDEELIFKYLEPYDSRFRVYYERNWRTP